MVLRHETAQVSFACLYGGWSPEPVWSRSYALLEVNNLVSGHSCLNCITQVKPTLTYSELFKQSKQGNQANNHADCQRGHAESPLQLLLERGYDPQCGGYRACYAMQEIPAVFCGHLPASLALMRPMPAVTAANAPTRSGAPPLRI